MTEGVGGSRYETSSKSGGRNEYCMRMDRDNILDVERRGDVEMCV